MSLEGVVKSDTGVEQRCTPKEGVKPRLRGGCLKDLPTLGEALWCTLFEGRIVEDY